jgi:hypothetical protein
MNVMLFEVRVEISLGGMGGDWTAHKTGFWWLGVCSLVRVLVLWMCCSHLFVKIHQTALLWVFNIFVHMLNFKKVYYIYIHSTYLCTHTHTHTHFVVLGIDPRALHMLGKCSITKSYPQPLPPQRQSLASKKREIKFKSLD